MGELPVTYTDVAYNLSMLSRELANAARELATNERKAVEAKEAFTVAYARAFLATEGVGKAGRPTPVATREATAQLATHDERLAADLAEAHLRAFRGYIAALRTRIDCARSGGTLLRAELELDKVR